MAGDVDTLLGEVCFRGSSGVSFGMLALTGP